MKKIAVLGSESAILLKAVVEYLKGKDVEISCLFDCLNSEILQFAKECNLEHIYLPYEKNAEFFGTKNFDLIILADYEHELPQSVIAEGKFLNIHPSLLPAFKGKDAIYRAFQAGVKVSGVTVLMLKNEIDGGRILAQYPVLIGNTTHFDEFKNEIIELKKFLYPRVIEAILNDKVFDFSDLFKNGCQKGGCSSCSGCH